MPVLDGFVAYEFYILHSHWPSVSNCPIRVQNVICSPSSYNGRSHTSSRAHGKIIER